MKIIAPRIKVCMECVDYDRGGYCQCARSIMYRVQVDEFGEACNMFMSRVAAYMPPKKRRKKIESIYDYE